MFPMCDRNLKDSNLSIMVGMFSRHLMKKASCWYGNTWFKWAWSSSHAMSPNWLLHSSSSLLICLLQACLLMSLSLPMWKFKWFAGFTDYKIYQDLQFEKTEKIVRNHTCYEIPISLIIEIKITFAHLTEPRISISLLPRSMSREKFL